MLFAEQKVCFFDFFLWVSLVSGIRCCVISAANSVTWKGLRNAAEMKELKNNIFKQKEK